MEILNLIIKSKLKNKEALEELTERFTPLIKKLSNKYYIRGYSEEDLKQIGFLSLIKAIKKYDINSGKSPIAYIKSSIENNYFYEIRKNAKENYIVSLDKEDENGALIDIIPSLENIEERYLEEERINSFIIVLNNLESWEKEVLRYAFSKKYGGIKKYSELMGIKYYEARKIKECILKKIKKQLKNDYKIN